MTPLATAVRIYDQAPSDEEASRGIDQVAAMIIFDEDMSWRMAEREIGDAR